MKKKLFAFVVNLVSTIIVHSCEQKSFEPSVRLDAGFELLDRYVFEQYIFPKLECGELVRFSQVSKRCYAIAKKAIAVKKQMHEFKKLRECELNPVISKKLNKFDCTHNSKTANKSFHHLGISCLYPGLLEGYFAHVDSYPIQTLDFRFNKMEKIYPHAFRGVNFLTLNVSNNELKKIKTGTFQELNGLWGLYLAFNNLIELKQGAFKGLSNLQELRLEYNQLTKLDQGVFEGLSSVKKLFLFNNRLKELGPKVFNDLKQLHELNLSYNKLEKLSSDEFNGLLCIEKINLSHNMLTELDAKLFRRLPKLKMLMLHGNRLKNEDMQSLKKDLESIEIIYS